MEQETRRHRIGWAVAYRALNRIRHAQERASAAAAPALADPLTGLPDRQSFMARLGEEMGRARAGNTRLALLLLDLDGFEEADDEFGRSAGDRARRRIGDNLVGLLRPGDFVARTGRDQFVMILPDVLDNITADRLRRRVELTLAGPGRAEAVPASIGLALGPEADETAAQLLDRAAQAMHQDRHERTARRLMRLTPLSAPVGPLTGPSRRPSEIGAGHEPVAPASLGGEPAGMGGRALQLAGDGLVGREESG